MGRDKRFNPDEPPRGQGWPRRNKEGERGGLPREEGDPGAAQQPSLGTFSPRPEFHPTPSPQYQQSHPSPTATVTQTPNIRFGKIRTWQGGEVPKIDGIRPKEEIQKDLFVLTLQKQLLEKFDPLEAQEVVNALHHPHGEEEDDLYLDPSSNILKSVPPRFEAGQVFLLPGDHSSGEGYWKVATLLEREGSMIIEQVNGRGWGRREKVGISSFKALLGQILHRRQVIEQRKVAQRNRQEGDQEKHTLSGERSGNISERRVLRPGTKARVSPPQKSDNTQEGTLPAVHSPAIERSEGVAARTIPKTSPEAPRPAYFKSGSIIHVSRGEEEEERYRVINSKNSLVTIHSIDNPTKPLEEVKEEELKRVARREKFVPRPVYAPLQDFFRMYSSKTAYDVHQLLEWKRKWFDSGNLDAYRKEHGNVAISDEQIEDAKKAFEVYIQAIQKEDMPGDVARGLAANITLCVRILTGVQDPAQNDIEYFVTHQILHTPYVERVQEKVEASPAEAHPPVASISESSTAPETPSRVFHPQPAQAPPQISPQEEARGPQETEPRTPPHRRMEERDERLKAVTDTLEAEASGLRKFVIEHKRPLWYLLGSAIFTGVVLGTALSARTERPAAAKPTPELKKGDTADIGTYLESVMLDPKFAPIARDIMSLSSEQLMEKYVGDKKTILPFLIAERLKDNSDNLLELTKEEEKRNAHDILHVTEQLAGAINAAAQERVRRGHAPYAFMSKQGLDELTTPVMPQVTFGRYLETVKSALNQINS